MNIIIVDDEIPALEDLKDVVCSVDPSLRPDGFSTCAEAIEAAKRKKYDVAFLDITMPGRDGITLALSLKKTNEKMNFVFVTGYRDYAVSAFYLNASGYILKPARKVDVQNVLSNLRFPVEEEKKRLRVHCFGNFEVFLDNKPLRFRRSKSKEIFAYLVNLKGASANTNELCAAVFENESESSKHYLRTLLSDIKNTLENAGLKNVFLNNHNSFSVAPDEFECDYYNFLQNDPQAISSYLGEYMNQYSWAESTNGFLSECTVNRE